jgi:hypothetical protein
MKLNHLIGGLVVLCLASVQMGLPPLAPIIIIAIGALAFIAWPYVFGVFYATFKTIKYFSRRAKAFKQVAKVIQIRESISDLKAKIYKNDESATHILNFRSEQYKAQFASLARILPGEGQQFEIKSSFDFQNSDKILHTIEAKTAIASMALTDLKNTFLEEGVDVLFS